MAPRPTQLPMLDTIARNGERLITICNDLLTLGGIDSGGTLVGARPGRPVRAARPRRGVAPPAAERAPSSTSTFDVPDEPVVVLGDRVQLERALINLLSNAVKFTEDGGTVALPPRARSDGRGLAGRPRHRHRDPGRRAGRPVQQVLPLLHRPGARDPRHRPRPVDRGRASSRRTAAGSAWSRRTSRARPSPSACRASAADPYRWLLNSTTCWKVGRFCQSIGRTPTTPAVECRMSSWVLS